MTIPRSRFLVLFSAIALTAACGPTAVTEPVGFEVSGSWMGVANDVRISFTMQTFAGPEKPSLLGSGSLTILSTGQVLPFNVGGQVVNASRGEVSVMLNSKETSPTGWPKPYGTFVGKLETLDAGRQLRGGIRGTDQYTIGPFTGVTVAATPLNLSRP